MYYSTTLLAITGYLAVLTVATITAEECTRTNVTSALQPLKSSADFTTCTEDTNVTFPFTLFALTHAKGFCASTACRAVLDQTTELELPNCGFTLGGTTYNLTDIVDLVGDACLSSSDASSLNERVKSSTGANSANSIFTKAAALLSQMLLM